VVQLFVYLPARGENHRTGRWSWIIEEYLLLNLTTLSTPVNTSYE